MESGSNGYKFGQSFDAMGGGMEVNEGILRRLRVLEAGGGYRDDGIDNGTGFRDFTYVVLRGNLMEKIPLQSGFLSNNPAAEIDNP